MAIFILETVLAFIWLLYETKWMTVKLALAVEKDSGWSFREPIEFVINLLMFLVVAVFITIAIALCVIMRRTVDDFADCVSEESKKEIGKLLAAKERRRPQLVGGISLPDDAHGLISVRRWKTYNGVLVSPVFGTLWTDTVMLSDKLPQKENSSGIYGRRLGKCVFEGWDGITDCWGIIAQRGKYELHKDGVLRSEAAELLLLLAGSKKNAKNLSSFYGVPAMVCKNFGMNIRGWLSTVEGKYWQRNNEYLLSKYSVKRAKVIGEVEGILEKAGF